VLDALSLNKYKTIPELLDQHITPQKSNSSTRKTERIKSFKYDTF